MATNVQPLAGGRLDEIGARAERSLWGDAWRRLKRNRASLASIIVIAFFTLVAIFAPLIAPQPRSANRQQ